MSEEQPVTELINSEENVDGLVLSGKRERRKPEQFSVSMTPAKTPKKDVKYQGSGTQLIENDAFCKHLDKHKGDDELIKLIHRLLFGTEGKIIQPYIYIPYIYILSFQINHIYILSFQINHIYTFLSNKSFPFFFRKDERQRRKRIFENFRVSLLEQYKLMLLKKYQPKKHGPCLY